MNEFAGASSEPGTANVPSAVRETATSARWRTECTPPRSPPAHDSRRGSPPAAQISLLKSIGSTAEASASLNDWFIAVCATVPTTPMAASQASCSSPGQVQYGSAATRQAWLTYTTTYPCCNRRNPFCPMSKRA
mgnify:CR=1 FL=1